MRVIGKLIFKDVLVIIRDRGGLAMLFLMPMALVLIMSSLQDRTFKAIHESGVKLILLNQDADSLGNAVECELKNSEFFSLSSEIRGRQPSEKEIRDAVAAGVFQIGIIIPARATQIIRDRVHQNVNAVFKTDSMTSPVPRDSVMISIFVDPATKGSLRSTLQGSIRDFAARVESRIVLNELTREISALMMTPLPNLNQIRQEVVYYHEEYVARGNKTVIPNSVQHNVPAWTLFAMFFIVIPFASTMIREREEGSLWRLLTMPCTYTQMLTSKILVYMVVCWLQFAFILMMGIFLFPVFGLPALDIHGSLFSLSFMALIASVSAIGYGIVVGTMAQTHQQAAIFASISVVILAAVGGIWVPVFIMPPFFRAISVVSPLNWGLNGFYDILLRHATLADVYPYCIRMVAFAAGCLVLATLYHKLRKDFN